MTPRLRSLAVLPLCVALLGARTAHADPTAAKISSARHAFEVAVSLEADQHWADAALQLREAISVKDTPGLRFHLAHCEAEQGFLVEASLDYDRASELLRQGAKAPDVLRLLEPASAELKRRIPHLTVEIPSDLSAPRAELDGRPYAPSELLSQPLNPGQHQLKVSAARRLSFERSLSVHEGDVIAIRAELPASPSLAAPVTSPPPVRSARAVSEPASRNASARAGAVSPVPAAPGSSAKLYLLLGESAVTVAGLALGIGYAQAEASETDRIKLAQGRIDEVAPGNPTACATPDLTLSGPCLDLRGAIGEHDRAVKFATIGFVGAGLGAAALVTTWLVFPTAEPAAAAARLRPLLGLGRIGLAGRF